MRLLVVGGGGREHALCWALRRDREDATLFCAPGNPGTALVARNLPIPADDLDALTAAADAHSIDLTIIGPEVPLALGLADRLRARGRRVFGPDASAARLEASKAFAKDLMQAAGVPTADSRTFTRLPEALAWVAQHPEPLVVKASGLAAGKGVIVCADRSEAADAVRAMLVEGRFGEAGGSVVIEHFLEGEEVSVLAVTDGRRVELLPASQDHKRLQEGDAGPNTGGMGAYSPVTIATADLLERVTERVLLPALAEMERRHARFRGLLYAGLMVDPGGDARVVEFNCRFGDPEAQVVLPLLAGDLLESLAAVADGGPPAPLPALPGLASVTTVLAAEGYPERPQRGAEIRLPESLPEGVIIFHAGTTRDGDGTLRTHGGRVLNVTAVAESFEEARRRSRTVAESIAFDGKVFRRDIGWREAARRGA